MSNPGDVAMNSDEYRVYRLMQTPSRALTYYRERILWSGHLRSALIFPEEIIAQQGKMIFVASAYGETRSKCTVEVAAHEVWSTVIINDIEIDQCSSFSQITSAEAAGQVDYIRIRIPGYYSWVQAYIGVFTAAVDAYTFAAEQMQKRLSR